MAYLLLMIASPSTMKILKSTLLDEFTLHCCETGKNGLQHILSEAIDIAIVESKLPDMRGVDFLKTLRKKRSEMLPPILFLGADKKEEEAIEAFNLGVEDYMAGPFATGELLARTRAIIRRKNKNLSDSSEILTISGVQIDATRRRCIVGGKSIKLPPLEFELLRILMRKAGRVLTRPYLLSAVWNIHDEVDTRAVDAAVSRLRRLLGKKTGRLIETVSKMGYYFVDEELP